MCDPKANAGLTYRIVVMCIIVHLNVNGSGNFGLETSLLCVIPGREERVTFEECVHLPLLCRCGYSASRHVRCAVLTRHTGTIWRSRL